MTGLMQHTAAFIWACIIISVMMFLATEVADRNMDATTAIGDAWNATPEAQP